VAPNPATLMVIGVMTTTDGVVPPTWSGATPIRLSFLLNYHATIARLLHLVAVGLANGCKVASSAEV